MRQTKIRCSLCLLFATVLSLSYVQAQDFLSKCKKVASRNGTLVTCDYSLLKETITIPLSVFAEDLQIIKLDDADDALVKAGYTIIGEKYILVKGRGQIPYKLFERKTGKFITNIGSVGQGPGEYHYLRIYREQYDEENDRLYLLMSNSKQLSVYDLKGNALPPIPLCYDIRKGSFHVDMKAGTVLFANLPFEGMTAVVWLQTIEGKLIKFIPPGHLSAGITYNDEMSSFKTKAGFDFSIFTYEPRKDTAYHYDVTQNKLIPTFTMDFKSNKMPIHTYIESENYFLGDLKEEKQVSEDSWVTQNERYYIIDKKTLKGSLFTIKNDLLDNKESSYPIYMIDGDYFVRNVDPGDLKDELERILQENKNLTPEKHAKFSKLKDAITENDNNYILYAKIKK